MGLTFCEKLEVKDLARKQQMTKPTLSSEITNLWRGRSGKLKIS
ncbi:hypothetical protein CY35_14G066800 [Sphagnum magellanicum]|nr:hypothetical protein CY35_14G066800 [Sphagnum magellanicum]